MALIDSHVHLTDSGLVDQVGQVLARAVAAGVERAITIGLSAADSAAALAVAERFPRQVWATIGIHPHEAGKAVEADFEQLAELTRHPSAVAVGEIGLDYHYDFAPRPVQQQVFARQLELAKGCDLPVVVHSREALPDTVRLLLEGGMSGWPVVFHCYSGSADELKILDEHGWWASFTGVVTFKNAHALKEMARTYPAEKLMIETDAPYLAPVPHRGQPNEPAHLVHTARCLAELRAVEYEALAARMTANTEQFFRLPVLAT